MQTLRDYMTFVNKVRFKMGVQGDDVRIAVTEAMDECIDEDILVDSLKAQGGGRRSEYI